MSFFNLYETVVLGAKKMYLVQVYLVYDKNGTILCITKNVGA